MSCAAGSAPQLTPIGSLASVSAGVEDVQAIADSAFVSPTSNNTGQPYLGRLFNVRTDGVSSTVAWRKPDGWTGHYLEVDLGRPWNVTTLQTQGGASGTAYVRSYTFAYSSDGLNWTLYREQADITAVLTGNVDVSSVVSRVIVATPARFVRFYPVLFVQAIALRVGVKGVVSASTSCAVCVAGTWGAAVVVAVVRVSSSDARASFSSMWSAKSSRCVGVSVCADVRGAVFLLWLLTF